MGRWIKYFANGEALTGFDEAIARGEVSWSQSKLDGMVGTSLIVDKSYFSIAGFGDYWQYDTYAASYPSGVELLSRSIQRLITCEDKFYRMLSHMIMYGWNAVIIFGTGNMDHLPEMDQVPYKIVPFEWTDKWFTWTYDIKTKQYNWSLRDRRG